MKVLDLAGVHKAPNIFRWRKWGSWCRRSSKSCATVLLFALSLNPILWGQDLPTVIVIATGGTIAMRDDVEAGGPVPALDGEALIQAVPELRELAELKVINFSNIPSDYMDENRWRDLSRLVSETLAEDTVRGVIITHGTDTLEETAFFLDLTVENSKPVVCIGAQRNASEKDADGPRNLINAVKQILSEKSSGLGVTVTMNHYINAARDVRKGHTSSVQTFESGEPGYLGYVDHDQVILFRRPLRRQLLPIPSQMPRVDLVSMYGGASGDHLRFSVDAGARGIIVQALGWGNVNEPMYEAIRYALGKGVPVVVSTRSSHGRVQPVYGFKGGGATLRELGVVFAGDLPAWKARILLMLALPMTQDRQRLQSYFDK